MALPEKVAKATQRFNPYALKISSTVPPWATLQHVGRTSGREYRTPVVAFAARAPIDPASVARPGAPVAIAEHRDILALVPLPWGADSDWYRNVRAAGEFTLTRKGVDFRVDELRLVDGDEARRMLGGVVGTASKLADIDQFVVGRLHRGPATATARG